ncbi:MAG: response regulator transcription factor [Alphaproteobacteria bacterium]|nr:response regulator transcription factor [Alphaproteobacteria bacterium]
MINVLIFSQNMLFKQDLSSQIKLSDLNYSCDEKLPPDIIVIDEETVTLAEVRQKFERTPVFVLLQKGTKSKEDSPFVKYIAKPFVLSSFLNQIKSALNFILTSDAAVISFNTYELFPLEKEIKNLKTGEKIKLTEREVSIILYLYKMKGKATTKSEFLEEVWGYNPNASTHTIETHIYRLRQKIEKNADWPELISTENGGYKLNF